MNSIRTITLALLFVGCSEANEGPSPSAEPTTNLDPTVVGPGTVTPNPTPTEAAGQIARRLTVDQLRRSIPALFDGITWTFDSRAGRVNAFDTLAQTLGEADYLQVTYENTEPSAMFAKFMDDMAGDVCGKAVTRDESAPADQRIIAPYAEDVYRNLRFLRLKLHGIYVPDASEEGLQDLAQLHNDVLAETNSITAAWYAVCVAMLTAPEFLSY